MQNSIIKFNDGDLDHYEPSDSEEEYTEKEKLILKKARQQKSTHSDSEEEVFGLEEESSENASNISGSDIEGQEDDDLPDVRAWGKSKRDFYSTDYVDPDYGGYQGKDAVAADLEEEEARNIQQRLAQELDDDDFSLDIFNKKQESETVENEEVIKTDLSTLPKRELKQYLEKNSPEYFILIDDLMVKMEQIKSFLAPIIKQNKDGKVPDCEAMEFVTTKYKIILNYCNNIYMYLLLKASKVNMQAHPVLKRLYQYRQLLSKLEPIYEEIIRPQLEIMIEMDNTKETNVTEPIKKSKKLKLLKKLDTVEKQSRKKSDSVSSNESVSQPPSKKLKLDPLKSILKIKKTGDNKSVSFDSMNVVEEKEIKEDEKKGNDEIEEEMDAEGEGTKRAITYQIAKNKGLTPRRKKEERNPRVKHRNKYRKAKIRRKGAVRTVRTETSRYGGEISGIKTTVSKSIKLK